MIVNGRILRMRGGSSAMMGQASGLETYSPRARR